MNSSGRITAGMFFAGIDIGSRTIELVVVDDRGEIVRSRQADTGFDPLTEVRKLMDGVHYDLIMATGYGRGLSEVAFDTPTVTEIKAHARGARAFFPRASTVLDIGGQDSKAIALLEDGRVKKFEMNDRCAAGTGKFLEIMANRLGVTINELFDMAAAGEVIPISSLCTVFAESEVINYIGEGKKREDIAAGVVDSVANKVVQLAQKKELGDRVILTGGLSHSIYFTGILSDKLDQKVESEEFGRFAGAYGAALLAIEKKDKRR